METTFVEREVERAARCDEALMVWLVIGSVIAAAIAVAAVGLLLI